MNIEQAKLIPVAQILEKLGCQPTKQKPHEAWYSSPLRNERTPSFHVNTKNNLWYDFGEAQGGSTIELVCCYLKSTNESHTVADALRWLRNMIGLIPVIKPDSIEKQSVEEATLVLKDKRQITHPALIQYLTKRGISLIVGKQYLEEVRVLNKDTGKTFFALSLTNEDGGFELRNPFFKGCIAPRTITFIRGQKPKPEGIHLFEGMMDYLSIITHQNGDRFEDDTIILNSLTSLNMATPYIHNYGYKVAYTWMDNDASGTKATNALAKYFKTQDQLMHRPMNHQFVPHKDVNDWHKAKLKFNRA